MNAVKLLALINKQNLSHFHIRDIAQLASSSVNTVFPLLKRLEQLGLLVRLKRGLWGFPDKVQLFALPAILTEPIQLISQEHHSPLTCIQGNFSHYDDENIAIARSALGQLSRHFQIPPDAIEKGLQALPPCRMELIKGMPLIILDVAHNPRASTGSLPRSRHDFRIAP